MYQIVSASVSSGIKITVTDCLVRSMCKVQAGKPKLWDEKIQKFSVYLRGTAELYDNSLWIHHYK